MSRASLEWATRGKPLTERELDTLRGAALGETCAETGARACYALETVKWHRGKLMAKLGAKNITHAVALAYERGIIVANGDGFGNGGSA